MKPAWERQRIKGINMEVVEPDTLPSDGVESYIKGQFALVSRKRRTEASPERIEKMESIESDRQLVERPSMYENKFKTIEHDISQPVDEMTAEVNDYNPHEPI